MRFDSSMEGETDSKLHDMWDDMAFVICAKNTNDMKDLIGRVKNYKPTSITVPTIKR